MAATKSWQWRGSEVETVQENGDAVFRKFRKLKADLEETNWWWFPYGKASEACKILSWKLGNRIHEIKLAKDNWALGLRRPNLIGVYKAPATYQALKWYWTGGPPPIPICRHCRSSKSNQALISVGWSPLMVFRASAADAVARPATLQ